MAIEYKIMGIEARRGNIESLKRSLELTENDVFIDRELRRNPMWSWKQTVNLRGECSHLAVVQDDAALCDGFKSFCEYLVRRLPDAIWMLYNHKRLNLPKYVIFRPGCCMGGVVGIIPTKYINSIIELHKEYPDYIHDDYFIHYWAHRNGVDVFSTFPSTVGTIDCESAMGHSYTEYERCNDPLNHKWANATKERYSNHKWKLK